MEPELCYDEDEEVPGDEGAAGAGDTGVVLLSVLVVEGVAASELPELVLAEAPALSDGADFADFGA